VGIKQLPALARVWLKANFPRHVIRIPPWLLRLHITDEKIKTACMIGGFLMALRGLYIWHPPLMWLLGGLALLWYGWPADSRRR
jgi:hypothetical protein